MPNPETYQDAFNLLCGDKIGEGTTRTVFECKLRPELVVKVEDGDMRDFANVVEAKFWSEYEGSPAIAKWLAPVEFLSPDGRILLQRRADPVREKELPKKIPAFLADTKVGNFGRISGRIVCVDYAITIINPSVRLRKAKWW